MLNSSLFTGWHLEMSMPTARHGLVAVAIDNVSYVMGGRSQSGESTSI